LNPAHGQAAMAKEETEPASVILYGLDEGKWRQSDFRGNRDGLRPC
jgi:hypothetical protein